MTDLSSIQIGKSEYVVLSNTADIAPTTLGLCGIAKPDWMEGTDLSGYRVQRGGSLPLPDSVYMQNVIPTGHSDSINTVCRDIVTRDGWKYIGFENRSWLLVNLEDDP